MKILIKSNPSNPGANPKEFYQNDVYALNPGFKHQMYKIKIPIAHAKKKTRMPRRLRFPTKLTRTADTWSRPPLSRL